MILVGLRKAKLVLAMLLAIPYASAQISNLDACKFGRYSCDHAKLTSFDLAVVLAVLDKPKSN